MHNNVIKLKMKLWVIIIIVQYLGCIYLTHAK